MPASVEHKVEMFQLARERQDVGLPVWDRRISFADVFHNENMTFEQRRDAIARRLRSNPWLQGRDECDDLVDAVERLAYADDADEFDGAWDEIYDHADYDRVWITTR